jgi:2-C-methyl-D-erythritol 2,4-cyclodiphosphate synthase
MNFRIGIGVDAHRFVSGRPLVLGGVEIPHTHGLEAHSDGDVIAHALLDALFGAAALGDKGTHFPPSDPQYKNIRSTKLLARACETLAQHGWHIVNADVSLLCEKPSLAPHVPAMKRALAEVLRINSEQISVKGSTLEGLGFTGREEGAAAVAVVLIESKI